MMSELRQNLNKHEKILERYKNILLSEKNSKSIIEGVDPNHVSQLNNLNNKISSIKESCSSNKNHKLRNDNISNTEKKLEDLLYKANKNYENENVMGQTKRNMTLTTQDQVKNILEINNLNKISNTDREQQTLTIINKYENNLQNDSNIENIFKANNSEYNIKYRDNLLKALNEFNVRNVSNKDMHTIKNPNLNNLIASNNNIIENIKKKYANNIQENNIINTISFASQRDFNLPIFPVQKNFLDNFNHHTIANTNNTSNENIFEKKLSPLRNQVANLAKSDEAMATLTQKFLGENTKKNLSERIYKANDPNSPETEKAKKIAESFIHDKINATICENINNIASKKFESDEINSILNKYASKVKGLYNNQYETSNQINSKNLASNFTNKVDEVNKKIDAINFTFHKNEDEKYNRNEDSSANSSNNSAVISKIMNDKIAEQQKHIIEKEKKEQEKDSDSEASNYLYDDQVKDKNVGDELDQKKNKNRFIQKINFIEEKLSQIENLINLNEKINTQNKTNQNDFYNSSSATKPKDFRTGLKKDFDDEEENELERNNINLPKIKSKQDLKFCKKSVFAEINKTDDFTTDEENQKNNILSFADNIKNLKILKEKNNNIIEALKNKSSPNSDNKFINKIPYPNAKKSRQKNNELKLSYSKINNEFNIPLEKALEKNFNKEKNSDTKQILNDLMASEKMLEPNCKDFIDEQMELEKSKCKKYEPNKSNICNPNSSAIGNMTLSYSISSYEPNDDSRIDEHFEQKEAEDHHFNLNKKPEQQYISYNTEEDYKELINPQQFEESRDLLDNSEASNEEKNHFSDFVSSNTAETFIKSHKRTKSKVPAKNLISFDEFFGQEEN